MRIDKLTTKFQQALSDAQSLAVGHDHTSIEAVHVLSALLGQEDGGTASLLARAGVNLEPLKAGLKTSFDQLPKVAESTGEVAISRDLNNLLNLTDKHAQKRGDAYIASEMFLLALAEDKGDAGRLLKQVGLNKATLESAINAVRGGESVSNQEAEGQREALKKYTLDLTERARLGKLDPVIGRDDEIRRAIQVLQRRTKNNPVLIGEPGVGKTATIRRAKRYYMETPDPHPAPTSMTGASMVDAMLKKMGSKPWLAARPPLVVFLAVHHIGSAFMLDSKIDQGELMRESFQDAAWNAAIYVAQIEDERVEQVIRTPAYLDATSEVLQRHGGLWFNDETFVVTRRRY